MTTRQILGRVCVVWLAPGVERLIPVAATSLGGAHAPPPACRLSVPALVALLAVLVSADVPAAPQPGREDADAAPIASPPIAAALDLSLIHI